MGCVLVALLAVASWVGVDATVRVDAGLVALVSLLAPAGSSGAATRESVHQCIVGDGACDVAAPCPAEAPARDCLRAAVPFRSNYARLECCFRCCVRHWLKEAGLLRNVDYHVSHLERVGFERGGASPDTADYGVDPYLNLLVHPHAFSAVSHVKMHPHMGCQMTDANASDLPFTLVSMYQYDANVVVIPKFSDRISKEPSPYAPCVQAMRTARQLVMDVWRQAKFAPEPGVWDAMTLYMANNIGNFTYPYCPNAGTKCFGSEAEAYERFRERVIGVRAVSLWQATLRHELLPTVPRQQRLLLCCCMNIDAKHNGPFGGSRTEKLRTVAAHPEFRCPIPTTPKHLGPPVDATPHPIEDQITQSFDDASKSDKTKYKPHAGKFDVSMPVLLHGAKFVFSPNGIGEQCYREYESMISGAYPLVDESWWYPRRHLLETLPVVSIADWETVTPAFLHAKWAELERKSFDVAPLYLPHWYDAILTAVGVK